MKERAQALAGQTLGPRLLAALNRGNRVVLTATQHPPLPSRVSEQTTGSYVTVRTLQAGPGRGRVGSRDCSDLVLSATVYGGVFFALRAVMRRRGA